MFIKLTGSCPHCGIQKHQIDTSEEHAIEVLDKAFADHIATEHPEASELVSSPASTGGGDDD